MQTSAGQKFRAAVASEKPLQVIGAINAYTARMAEATGFKALYLSGGGVAANSLGMPDLGISTLEDVLTDVSRITEVTSLPLLVDIDTGWGSAFNIARTVRSMIKAGAGAVHMDRQGQITLGASHVSSKSKEKLPMTTRQNLGTRTVAFGAQRTKGGFWPATVCPLMTQQRHWLCTTAMVLMPV